MAILEDIKDLNNKSKDYLANVPTLKDFLKPIFGSTDERKEVCDVRSTIDSDSTRKSR
mgnify:FL=1